MFLFNLITVTGNNITVRVDYKLENVLFFILFLFMELALQLKTSQ